MSKKIKLNEITLKKKTTLEAPMIFTDKKRKALTLRLNRDAWKALNNLAMDKDLKAHDLLIEAVNDLYRKYDLPSIA